MSFDFVGARAIVNGSDRADYIAGLARAWLSKIPSLSGYSFYDVVPAHVTAAIPELAIQWTEAVGRDVIAGNVEPETAIDKHLSLRWDSGTKVLALDRTIALSFAIEIDRLGILDSAALVGIQERVEQWFTRVITAYYAALGGGDTGDGDEDGNDETGTGSGIAPDSEGVAISIACSTSRSNYRYQFLLTGWNCDYGVVPMTRIEGRAVRHSLTTTEIEDAYTFTTVADLAQLIAAKHGIKVRVATGKPESALTQLNYLSIRGQSEHTTLLQIAARDNLVLRDGDAANEIVIEDVGSAGTQVIEAGDLVSLTFNDTAITPGYPPLYPVSAELILSDRSLSLHPNMLVNLQGLPERIPESLGEFGTEKADGGTGYNWRDMIPAGIARSVQGFYYDVPITSSVGFGQWLIISLVHDFSELRTTVELGKYIPIEIEETGASVTGKRFTLDDIKATYEKAVVKVGSAAGAFISPDGHILTAKHVTDSSKSVTTRDGQTYQGKLIFDDATSDVAVLKIDGSGFPTIPIAPDTQPYRTGEDMTIFVFGHPGKVGGGGQHEWLVKQGTVKKIVNGAYKGMKGGDSVIVDDKTENFADPGDSGGAWFDAWGLCVAITSGGDAKGSGTGDEAWGAAIESIRALFDKHAVPYTTGTRSTGTEAGNLEGGAVAGWTLPSKGVVTSEFGYREQPTAGASTNHKGIDVSESCGAPIYAACDGYVEFAGDEGDGYGYSIKLSHGDGSIWTLYGHNQQNLVSTGQSVKAGQKIALEGTTGTSTGCHLHFGIAEGMKGQSNIFNGTFVNPRNYINFPKLS